MLHFQHFPYLLEIIRTKIISKRYDDPLARHFGTEKTRELVARKYYWPTLQADIDAYVKRCDVCLALKAVRYKLYRDLQLLPMPTHRWKDLSMDFVIGLLVSTNWKGKTYDSIIVIVDWLTKIVYYEPVKVIINVPDHAEVIIVVVVRHYGIHDSIVRNQSSVFTSKFWSSLCYFLDIKRNLSTTFYHQTDGQIEKQNSTIEAYLQAFVNYKQNDWVRLLPMAEFAYNNARNISTGYPPLS